MAAKQQTDFVGELINNEPMAKHTTWRVGGPAEYYFTPANIEDLSFYLSQLNPQEKIFWLGLGSNLLVRDGGIKGSVISTANALLGMELVDDNKIEVAAGVPCALLARFCARNNLLNGEFFAGIPGVVGGALKMNAGAFGGETWPLVDAVETIDRQGVRRWRQAAEFKTAYRTVIGHENEAFIKARFKLVSGDGEIASRAIKELLAKRAASQPTGTFNCGSVFRNPENNFAAKLIEESGLKAYRIGGACVSEKHTNFIINDKTATAADIENLILYVQTQVQMKKGVLLQPEVKIVGDF